MREILFRGKTGIGARGKWVHGFYTLATVDYRDGMDEPAIVCKDEYIFVIPETVGQYTGLMDKNGCKIFEGDIMGRLFEDHDENTIVLYKNGVLCVRPVSKEEYRPLNTFDNCGWVPANSKSNPNYNFEVLGNIYDNPELAEAK